MLCLAMQFIPTPEDTAQHHLTTTEIVCSLMLQFLQNQHTYICMYIVFQQHLTLDVSWTPFTKRIE